MVTRRGKMVTSLKQFLLIMLLYSLSCDLTRSRGKLKPLYLHYHSAYGTKLDRMETNLEQLLTIIFIYLLVTWSCKITWQAKDIIYSLPLWLLPPNLTGWWLTFSGFYPECYSTFLSWDLVISRAKTKNILPPPSQCL